MEGQPIMDNDQYVAQVNLQYQTYHCEYVPGFKKQRLHVLYYADYYEKLPKAVILFDPSGNEFEVAITKVRSRVYLGEGSERIGLLYQLTYGGWLTIVTLNPTTYYLRVKDRMGHEVQYPTPAKIFRLGEQDVPIPISDDELPNDEVTNVLRVENFYHSLFKTLTVDDISSSLLYLPLGFCEHAFPRTCSDVSLVDRSGKKWPCVLHWKIERPFYCSLMGVWANFCKRNDLKEGNDIQLGVANNEPHFMYFKLV